MNVKSKIPKNVKLKTYLVTILLVSVIFIGALSYTIGQPYIGDVSEVWVQPPFSEASYVVGEYNSTHYYARNSSTGEYEWLSTNASSVINNALGGLTSGRTWKEKVVLKGNFELSNPILIPSYSQLIIQGRVYAQDNYPNYQPLVRNVNFTDGNEQIEIRDGEIDGRNASQGSNGHFGIRLARVEDFVIDNVYVHHIRKSTNAYGYGMRIIGCVNGIVKNCRVEFCPHIGISVGEVTDAASKNIIITNNRLYHIRKEGDVFGSAAPITVGGSPEYMCERIMVIGNQIYDSDKGIQFYGDVIDSSISNNILGGIWTQAIIAGKSDTSGEYPVQNCIVSDNIIKATANTEYYAIYVAGDYNVVTGNKIDFSAAPNDEIYERGIQCTGVNYGLIANNHIYFARGIGIRLSGYGTGASQYSRHTLVIGNLIYGRGSSNCSDGIVLTEDADNNTIKDNIFRNILQSGKYCILLETGANYNFIDGNDMNGNNNDVSNNGTGTIWGDNLDKDGNFDEGVEP